jgi:hypothetical protein
VKISNRHVVGAPRVWVGFGWDSNSLYSWMNPHWVGTLWLGFFYVGVRRKSCQCKNEAIPGSECELACIPPRWDPAREAVEDLLADRPAS